MRPVSVLFTNNTLGPRAGSELYVRDVALALQRRGHRPMAFSLVLGPVADEMRAATIPVVHDVTRIGDVPDVIHGHHHVETLIAALAFPDAPIVNFCHGWVPWEEMPLRHPAVRRYVAVDEVCVDRLVREEGISADRIDLVLNFVDLDRFRPRPALPEVPRQALVLSNSARQDGYAGVIAAACQASGITVDIVGQAAGNSTGAPEALLAGYDLVFAKGRTALEALAVGCATIVSDSAGAGPLVVPGNYERLRRRNFGIRELQHAHDEEWYRQQIAAYSRSAADEVSRRVRAEAGIEPAIDQLLAIYRAAMAEPCPGGDRSAAAARHLMRIAQPLKEAHHLRVQQHDLTSSLARAQSQLNAALARGRALDAAVAALQSSSSAADAAVRHLEEEVRARDAALAHARQEAHALLDRIARLEALATLRIRDAVLRVPVLGAAMHAAARRLAQRLRQ